MSLMEEIQNLRSGATRFEEAGIGRSHRTRIVHHLEAPSRVSAATEALVVLVPALNEEHGIGQVLEGIPTADLERMRCDPQILVVDGASTDGTREVARALGAKVFVQKGRGKGTGVRQAMHHLLTEASDSRSPLYVVMLDADGTYPAEDIPRFLAALRAGFDVVVGSRFLGDVRDDAMTRLNRLGNQGLSLLARTLYGVPITDVCTGMWGFSREFLERCDFEAKGFELEAEIYAFAALCHARIAEVPIEYRPRVGDAKLTPLKTGLRIAWWLLRKRFRAKGTPLPAERGTGTPYRGVSL